MEKFNKTNLNSVKRGAKRATYEKEKVYAILDSNFLGHISYIYEGIAIAIPMAYGRNGDKIYLHGSLANRMFTALLKEKQCSMTVTNLDGLVLAKSGFHHSVNYRSVSIFGTLHKIENNAEKTIALKCIMDNMIQDRWKYLREMTPNELKRTLVVELTIQYASAKIRNSGVEDDKSDALLPIWSGLIPIQQVAKVPVTDEKFSRNMEVPEHVQVYYQNNKPT